MGDIAERAIGLMEESFIASSGPGGQNVNKVATAVQLRLNIFDLRLDPETFNRLKSLAGSRMNSKGEVIITARSYRTQEANRSDARERMLELLAKAQDHPAKRKKSRVNRLGKAKRIKAKKTRGAIKATRGKVDW